VHQKSGTMIESVGEPAIDGLAGDVGGLVPLRASTRLQVDAASVVAALTGAGAGWLSGATELESVNGLRRFAVDLRFRVGPGSISRLTFRKAALLDIGTPWRGGGGWVAEIGWRASGAAPLFPVFSGQLKIGPVQLRIDGLYAPPGGSLGRIADRVLLHIAAQATASWLLDEVNRVVDSPARERSDVV